MAISQTPDEQTPDRSTAKAAAPSPKSLRMPRVVIADTRDLVAALEELAGPASRQVVFSSIGKSPSGGAADLRWSAVGYYGFAAKSGSEFTITDRGRALLSSDSAVEQEAMQHAVMSTGFGPVIYRFRGRPVNAATITSVFQGEGIQEAASAKLAETLQAAAAEAGLIADGKFDAVAIERAHAAASVAPPPGPPPARRATAAKKQADPADPPATQTPPAPREPARPAPPEAGQSGPFGVSVEIKVDAKDHTPEEIGAIVSQVREALSGPLEG